MQKPKSAVPTLRQLEFQDWSTGLFIHFGIRTFNEGLVDFDERKMDLQTFNPSDLNCDQWMEVAQKAGMQYAVLTAKHHDGFANWPTKFTDYSVSNTPWKNGNGDVVKEFVEACRKYGIKPGIYYSPADTSSELFHTSERDYDQYFIDQISELLSGYGEIDVLWFDGCGSGGHTYDWSRIVAEIRRLQPQILIFNMGDPDYRWVGNEIGLVPLPCWNTEDGKWLPYECDFQMRHNSWFYSELDGHTVKSLSELMGIYYYSVGRGANMLINIGPDRRGHLPEKDAARLIELGEEIENRFAHPIGSIDSPFASGDLEWSYRPAEPFVVDHAVIEEDLTEGEFVISFEIAAVPMHNDTRFTVYEGRNIGHKAICRFPPVKVREIIIKITHSDGNVRMRKISFYHVGEGKDN